MRRTRRDERGSITPFVVIISLAILLLAALVIDGGRQLNAKGRAIAYAQEAARAGAQAVDVTDPRLDLNPQQALRAAATYCAQAKSQDSQLTSCVPRIERRDDGAGEGYYVVSVRAQIDLRAILLGLIGRNELQSSGGAIARPVSGISEADSGKISTIPPPSLQEPDGGQPTGQAPPAPPTVTASPCAPVPTDTPSPRPTRTPRPDPSASPSPTASPCRPATQ